MSSLSLSLSQEEILSFKPTHRCISGFSQDPKPHPKADEVARRVRDYFVGKWPWPSEEAKQHYIRMNVETTVSYWFPTGRDDLIEVASIWCTYYFVLDDMMEYVSGEAQRIARVFPITRGHLGPTEGDPFEAVVYDIHRRCRSAGDPLAIKLFEETSGLCIEWMESVLLHRKRVAAGEIPTSFATFDDVMKVRKREAGTPVTFPMIRWMVDIPLPREVIQHPDVQALEDLTVIHGLYVNDLYSFRKETKDMDSKKRQGGPIVCPNAVVLLVETEGMTVQGAMKKLGEELVTIEEEFLRVAARARKSIGVEFGENVPDMIQRYIDALMIFVPGNLEWHATCPRYNDLSNY